ncbi:hypothetical protein CRUP_005301 [Coryphaenoides rupestris]|nr:hypothetical protein CRUP_005301 [Coryphaenoides rupestris]
MQRRHSSNTDGLPPERSRSQTLGSENSLDEGCVFECLKADPPACPQQLFSGLVGVPSGSASAAAAAAPFQAAGLVLGSPPDVFIQMTASSREDGGGASHHSDGGSYVLPRPPPPHHHHYHHHFHHQQPLQHRTSSLLQQATAAAGGPGGHGSREEGPPEEQAAPAPALSELKAEERSVLVALWITVFLTGNVVFLYYTFSQEELYNSLVFAKPNIDSLDFFHLVWAVGITDFVLKFCTISLKCLVLSLPRILLAFRSRGKLYLLLEELSQLFRALLPIQLWYKYIMGAEPSSSYLLGASLIIIYSLCKSFDICGRLSSLRKALVVLCGAQQSVGVRASSQQCVEAGDVCSICHKDFRDPLVLLCQHVFCEDCLSVWFDRERACPLCRSSVIESLRCWKDGTTSAHFQIY